MNLNEMSRGLACVAAVLLGGCASAAPKANEATGTASIAITNAPADGTCLQVTVAGYRTVVQDFDLMPGASTVLALSGLPLGSDTFTASAYGSACAMVNTMTVPNWVSDPVTATIAVSPTASVALVMHRDGNASVSVDFPDEPDGAAPDASMPPCMLTSCAGVCVDPASDPNNCGACGHSCQGGACMGATCQPLTLAAGLPGPAYLAADGTNVYFANFNGGVNGSVMAVPVSGGMPTTLAAGQTQIGNIAVDSTSIYWLDATVYGGPGEVMKLPLAGGMPTTLYSGAVTASGIALDATSVYFFADSHLFKLPLAGGTAFMLGTDTSHPQDLALSGGYAYWLGVASDNTGTMAQVPLGGGTSGSLVLSGLNNPQAMAADSTGIYWTDYGDGYVLKVAVLPTGPALTRIAGDQKGPYSIAVDATNAYWTNLVEGSVMYAPITGGIPATLVANAGATRLAIDTTSVYWADGSAIRKIAKP
jgi:hypothetical protein